jgi:iron complex transport system ATP-binding protein
VVVSIPRLNVEDLSYGYPGHIVGQGISFAVSAGEVLCVLGRNGEGKSTLFKTILGLLPARAGVLRVDGEPIAGWSPQRRVLTFGYVPQNGGGTFPFTVPQNGGGTFPFTVAELVLMGRIAHRGPFSAPSAEDREAANEAIATLGIGHLAEREWLRVSGGERQLALVARAFAQGMRILVLDEPTASLDFGNQVRVLDAVRGLAETRGLSVLLSTHHPEQAFACADRVAVLAGGELLRIGTPAEVVTPETLRACYGVEVTVLPVADDRYRVCVPRSYLS